ncbi:uncharacterized protein CANTADRAFT_152991 [Suhomyces tanzawaensis NRRL Y-17324]|uniref:Uncharacterized protein n=1 Tax=Suhomyces tanzawaensis NRRL Y-17324 TaxID=984487 RepID=A0A1E4SM16_9ASCO|nr:uncharacterized protein CANTADRAFT_152991 [Suhomyces tanzawaensis NRRL Y-17324]ODV80569.1 hypothetical protein CANTADRAFT_152991 [Suhomyces tanzawaensis NRRL Y-17324]
MHLNCSSPNGRLIIHSRRARYRGTTSFRSPEFLEMCFRNNFLILGIGFIAANNQMKKSPLQCSLRNFNYLNTIFGVKSFFLGFCNSTLFLNPLDIWIFGSTPLRVYLEVIGLTSTICVWPCST